MTGKWRFFVSSPLKSTQKSYGQKKDIDIFSSGGEFTLIDHGGKHDEFVIKKINHCTDILENNSVEPLR